MDEDAGKVVVMVLAMLTCDLVYGFGMGAFEAFFGCDVNGACG